MFFVAAAYLAKEWRAFSDRHGNVLGIWNYGLERLNGMSHGQNSHSSWDDFKDPNPAQGYFHWK